MVVIVYQRSRIITYGQGHYCSQLGSRNHESSLVVQRLLLAAD